MAERINKINTVYLDKCVYLQGNRREKKNELTTDATPVIYTIAWA
jgi:hypothetical protein